MKLCYIWQKLAKHVYQVLKKCIHITDDLGVNRYYIMCMCVFGQ